MRNVSQGTSFSDFDAVRLSVASSRDILDWSHGEVLKPETINYRTQKPEKDGLFCERIFGPSKDINVNDARYKGIRSREAAVDKNGEIVTKSIVRRERMAHITLSAPVTHIWFLRGTPSAISQLTNMTVKNLERVTYFAAYLILKVDKEKVVELLANVEAEQDAAKAAIKLRYEKQAKEEAENADVKALAEAQTKEMDELASEFGVRIDQLKSLQLHVLISETDYRNLPEEYQDLIEVQMGGDAIQEMLESIDMKELITRLTSEVEEAKGQRKKKLLKRLRTIESMHKAGIEPKDMCLTVLPVIPPDLRPMVQLTGGRFATSDLNDLYRRVINRNNRLKKLNDLKAPEVIRRNEKRMLQEAVDALIDNNASRSGRAVTSNGQRRKLKSLADMLKGKQGRFRQNLLGKRVDYSGRSVIVSGPTLRMDECGLPKMMALELFKPFVIGRLIELEQAHNIRSASRMIELGEVEVWDALDSVIKGKYVLLNRAPSLHRLSVQAFQPRLIEGKAIQLHPLVCKGFNADFDGDQMAVHLPLSSKAQAEARDLMVASKNLLLPADGTPVLHIEQDIVLGAYYITYPKFASEERKNFSSVVEANYAYDAGIIKLQSPIAVPVKGEIRQTTLGRTIFNSIFPEDFPYQETAMTKKAIQKVMTQIYELYGSEKTAAIADDLKDIAFEYATQSGLSVGMEDFPKIEGVKEEIKIGDDKSANISDQYEQGLITNDERYRLVIENWFAVNNKIQEMVTKQYADKDTSMSLSVVSGARGSNGQVKQVSASIGIQSDTTGRAIELPVKSNFLDGLPTLEYFISTRGTRKSLVDIALRTADSGYLTRKLVDVSQDVFTLEESDSTDPGFPMHRIDADDIGLTFASRLEGRFVAQNIESGDKVLVKKGNEITRVLAAEIDEDESIETVYIMSVLSTPSVEGIPRKSYGVDPATRALVALDHPIGVIAAQSIGEPGTQLSLNSKHEGGVASISDETASGLNRVTELFEARQPKGVASLTSVSGIAKVWEDGNHYVVQVAGASDEVIELPLEGRKVAVADKSGVLAGDVLASKKAGTDPLIAPASGTIAIAGKMIILTPESIKTERYEIPGNKQLLVQDGDKVVAGQQLTAGSVNVQDLLSLKGVEETQRYILTEISRVFTSQGKHVSDKHFEVIIKQMFSRVQVEDAGDSEFVTGDIVSKASVIAKNQELVTAGKQPVQYHQLLLGITKVSTSSDSFLSAASFQDTTRVLIGAATSGRIDYLKGLKENVILGRKIPVGTGVIPDEEPEEELAGGYQEPFAVADAKTTPDSVIEASTDVDSE